MENGHVRGLRQPVAVEFRRFKNDVERLPLTWLAGQPRKRFERHAFLIQFPGSPGKRRRRVQNQIDRLPAWGGLTEPGETASVSSRPLYSGTTSQVDNHRCARRQKGHRPLAPVCNAFARSSIWRALERSLRLTNAA